MGVTTKDFVLTYVLKLRDGCWYVGATKDLNHRLKAHFSDKGAKWTRLHPPVSVEEVLIGDREKEITLAYRDKYGKALVRGHAWTACNDPDYETYPDPIHMKDQVTEIINLFSKHS
jgi:predicted GIY-YIG superfamily endonuclease